MEKYVPDTTFHFTRTDDNVYVDTKVFKKNYKKEKEEKKLLYYKNKYKSLANLNQRFHLRQGTDKHKFY